MKKAFLTSNFAVDGVSKSKSAEHRKGRISKESAERQVQDLEGGFLRIALDAQREALAAGVGYSTIIHGVPVKIIPE